MPGPADLFNLGDDPYGRQSVEGIVMQTPASATALLVVSIPSFDTDQPDRLRWPGQKAGGGLPNVGDRCLVHFTKDGGAWVGVVWPS
jgi:hypothetical protein